MTDDVFVDLAFPVTRGRVPLDHGYPLSSALVGAVQELHEAPWLAIHPLSGQKLNDTTLQLNDMSRVTLRMPAAKAGVVMGLVNRNLRIGGEVFQLGSPVMRPLGPAPSLFAWRVAIRLTTPPRGADGKLDIPAFQTAFEAEAKRQLESLGIRGVLQVVAKRQLAVKGQTILAYSIEVSDLNLEDSIQLQVRGLGGKRRMGCGVFRSSRRPELDAE